MPTNTRADSVSTKFRALLLLPTAAWLACASADQIDETRHALTATPDTTQAVNYGVYATDRLDLANFATVTSALVGARGIVWAETDARIDGTVVSGTEIDLRDRTTVTGDARSTGPINLGNNVTVGGVRAPHVTVALPASLSASTSAVGSASYAVYAGTSRTLGPGSYRDLTVYANGTLILNGVAAGATFTFRRLVFEAGAKLVLNPMGGAMTIEMVDWLSVGDRVKTTLNGASDGRRIKWTCTGTGTLRVGTDVKPFYGMITAPNARVELADRSALSGAIRAKSVRIGVGSAVTGFAEATTCPAGHRPAGDLAGVCVNYIEESYAGEFIPPWINERGPAKFFETHADEFDTVVFLPAQDIPVSNNLGRSNSIQGINRFIFTPSTYPNLQSVVQADLYRIYVNSTTRFPLNTIHEIAHNWGIFIQGMYADPVRVPPGHWPNNIDLFQGDTRYLDPLQYFNWVVESGTEFCTGQHNFVGWKFSNLSLYLMGLLPPEQVGVIKLHDYEPKPGDAFFNEWGPSCGQDHVFTGTRTITMDDIIAANGPRVPSYATSPKDFRIAFVAVWPYGKAPEPEYLRYIHEEKQVTSDMWFELTGGRSHLVID